MVLVGSLCDGAAFVGHTLLPDLRRGLGLGGLGAPLLRTWLLGRLDVGGNKRALTADWFTGVAMLAPTQKATGMLVDTLNTHFYSKHFECQCQNSKINGTCRCLVVISREESVREWRRRRYMYVYRKRGSKRKRRRKREVGREGGREGVGEGFSLAHTIVSFNLPVIQNG